ADASFVNSGSLHPLNLLQVVAPYLFIDRVVGANTHELGLYLGAVPLMLIVWLLIDRKRLRPYKSVAWAAAGCGLASLVLAFGQYGGIYRLQSLLPLVGNFRFPCRYLALVQLSAVVLAAIGFVLLTRRQERGLFQSSCRDNRTVPVPTPWLDLIPLALVVGVSCLIAFAAFLRKDQLPVAGIAEVLAAPALMAGAAVLVAMAARGVRAAVPALILFAAADLGFYGLSYSVYANTGTIDDCVAEAPVPPVYNERRILYDLLRFDEPGQRTGNQATIAGWRLVDGYAGLAPRRQLDYHRLAALQAAGVGWVRRGPTTEDIPGLLPWNPEWFQVPSPASRMRLVTRAQTSDDPAADIARVPLESVALVEQSLELPGGPPGRASLLVDSPGSIWIEVDCNIPQLLLVSESYHAGWEATVDGRKRPVLRVNGDFFGCQVERGNRLVHFAFHPRGLHDGIIVTTAGLGILLLWLGIGLAWPSARGRRPRRESVPRRSRIAEQSVPPSTD
ncbi:MAG: YfhO family protein, partial [Tepidisphaeraceae bacterium]